jgi:hypothetical protein
MAIVRFKVAPHEQTIIAAIARRAHFMARRSGVRYEVQDAMMDVTATHSNGCRLDLQKLHDAPDFDFAHDAFGIRQHLDRDTGKLQHCFLPRCAAREEALSGEGHPKTR